MPPKKAATTSIVGEYDVELMTEQELKTYIQALEEEHKRMRKVRSLYHKDKNELLNFLQTLQDSITDTQSVNIQKNIEIQELMMENEQKLRSEDERNRITEMESLHSVQKDILESYLRLKMTEFTNKEKENELIRDITERDRDIENLHYISKLMSVESKESNITKRLQSSEKFKDSVENYVKEYNNNFLQTLEEFSRNKIEELYAILGDVSFSDNNPFSNILAKMTNFFKDIFWKNMKTIEKLESKLTDLKKELKTTTAYLREVTNKNNELKPVQHDPLSPIAPPTLTPTRKHSLNQKQKTLEDLTYENYLLTIKLEMLNKEYNELKDNFMSSVRRIHRTADFKALILEEKLTAQQQSARERC